HPHLPSFPTRRSSDLNTATPAATNTPANTPTPVNTLPPPPPTNTPEPTATATPEEGEEPGVLVIYYASNPSEVLGVFPVRPFDADRKSTRLNSSHVKI